MGVTLQMKKGIWRKGSTLQSSQMNEQNSTHMILFLFMSKIKSTLKILQGLKKLMGHLCPSKQASKTKFDGADLYSGSFCPLMKCHYQQADIYKAGCGGSGTQGKKRE